MPLVYLLICFQPVEADPLRLTIVLSEEGGNQQAFSDSLRQKLPSKDFQLMVLHADEPLGTSDLYVAVGLKAASRLASTKLPTLDVLLPKAGYDKLPHAGVHSAIFSDQPLARQVALLRAALPDVRQVGVLYAKLPPELPELRHLLAEKKLHLHERVVKDDHSISEALDELLNESEAIFVLSDPEVYNGGTVRNILLASYRKQIPFVVPTQAFVRAGALCAVISTPEQFAAQAARMIGHYAETGDLPAAQYPSEFEVLVNIQVARSLDLRIKDAEILRDEIRRSP